MASKSTRILPLLWKCFWAFVLSVLIAQGIFYVERSRTPTLAAPPAIADNHEEIIEAPFWVDADAGISWKIFGLEIIGKVMSRQTSGKYAVVMSNTPPEGGPPLHVHQHEDELFYVLEGTYEFRFGEETVVVNPGDLVHLPRHIPHSFRNIGSEPGVTMNTITPGGFEQFFVEIDQLPKDQPLEPQQIAEIASRYGLQFLPEEN